MAAYGLMPSACQRSESGVDAVRNWLNSANIGHMYDACVKEGWDEMDAFLDIDTNDKELDGLIADIDKHTSLKNSDKAKLRRAVKKLQTKTKEKTQENQSQSQSQSQLDEKQVELELEIGTGAPARRSRNVNSNGTKSSIFKDAEEKESNSALGNSWDFCALFKRKLDIRSGKTNITDEELCKSFECDMCKKTMSEINLYYCILCNGAVKLLAERKYYCLRHILLLHQEYDHCGNHKEIAIKEIKDITTNAYDHDDENENKRGDSDSDTNSRVIQKLTFDAAMIQASKKQSLETVQKSIVKYLNNRVATRIDHAKNATQIGAAVPAVAFVLRDQSEAFNLLPNVSDATFLNISNVAQIVSGVTAVVALGFHIHSYHKKFISGKEFSRRCVTTIAKYPVGAFMSGLGGGLAGTVATSAMAATAFAASGAAVGAVAVIASIFGAMAGIKIGNSICESIVNFLFEKIFGIVSDKKEKEAQIAQAFLYFQFNKGEIKTFKQNIESNKKKLQSKYRNYARLYHPDRNGGSPEKFAELQMNYGILRAVLDCELNDKEMNEVVGDSLKALMM